MNMQESQLAPEVKPQLLSLNEPTKRIVFIIALIFCLTPVVSPAIALVMGIAAAQIIGHPYPHLNNQATHWLLQASVVGLGSGMNIDHALQPGKTGLSLTIASITLTLLLGYFLGKSLNIDKKISYLIAAGTAICGGSAIAAISPVIKAQEKQISVALGCIFILNSIALFAFPMLGNYFHLSQSQFGLWCAIAIQDTSSVVGAASKYGPHALEVATTVKMGRALWIIPVAYLSKYIFESKTARIQIPYFIGLFVLAIIGNTYVPIINTWSPVIVTVAKAGLTLTLFLVGAGLSRKILKAVGLKPIIQGIALWIFISVTTLLAIVNFAAA